MKVSILEFETIGLRCPNAKVSFKNKETGSVINLLQMPNGTGKTTMIKLLSGTLTGEIENWTSDQTKSLWESLTIRIQVSLGLNSLL